MLTPSLTLAKLTQSEKGTVHFWAPELLHPEGTGHTKKTDVWAFGMTIYVGTSDDYVAVSANATSSIF